LISTQWSEPDFDVIEPESILLIYLKSSKDSVNTIRIPSQYHSRILQAVEEYNKYADTMLPFQFNKDDDVVVNPNIELTGNQSIKATGSGWIGAWNYNTIIANGDVQIKVGGWSYVRAFGNVHVKARDCAIVELHEQATVDAERNVVVIDYTDQKSTIRGNVICIRREE
jgi:ketosteroid isomerase-like protein